MTAALALTFMIMIASGSGESSRDIVLTGRVTVRGSEPHTMLVIASEERGDVRLIGSLAEEIRERCQGRIVRVSCRMTNEKSGPGFPAEAEVKKILDVK